MSGGARMFEVSEWSLEREQVLTLWWSRGRSASEIGHELNVSRNAVLGKVRRLGLHRRSKADAVFNMTRVRHGGAAGLERARKAATRTQPPKERVAPNKGQSPASAIIRRTRILPASPVPEAVAIDVSQARPWVTRRFGECAYPVGGEGADTLSCCLPADGPYCPGHLQLMHAPTKANEGLKKATAARNLRRAA